MFDCTWYLAIATAQEMVVSTNLGNTNHEHVLLLHSAGIQISVGKFTNHTTFIIATIFHMYLLYKPSPVL